MEARDALIIEAVRTPIGRGHPEKGYYKELHPNTLLAAAYTELLDRASVEPGLVDEVISGCVMQYGRQTYNIARNAWLTAGFPAEVPATTVDRQCGSAQQAVSFGTALISSGVTDLVIGAGVEHMGHCPLVNPFEGPHGAPWTPEMVERWDISNQGISAERIADEWGISRRELDEFGVRSHALAARATKERRFEREILPMKIDGATYTTDQGIRPGTTAEVLADLKPAFMEDGKITAGTSSQISDAAAAVLLASPGKANELGLKPRAKVVDHLAVGVEPRLMLTGPIPATRKILARNGLTIEDVDLIEINEAFASVVLAWERELGPDMDRVNPNGGAIALGHPVGCTGARLITTLLHELERTDKELGLVTMCCGGGLGTATLIQRV